MFFNCRNISLVVFTKKAVLKFFRKIPGKPLRRSAIAVKLQELKLLKLSYSSGQLLPQLNTFRDIVKEVKLLCLPIFSQSKQLRLKKSAFQFIKILISCEKVNLQFLKILISLKRLSNQIHSAINVIFPMIMVSATFHFRGRGPRNVLIIFLKGAT